MAADGLIGECPQLQGFHILPCPLLRRMFGAGCASYWSGPTFNQLVRSV